MTFSPTAARNALAAQIESYLDASEHPANVHPYPFGSIIANAVVLIPRAGDDGLYIDFRQTFGPRSLCHMSLWVEVRVGGASPDADLTMDRYLTPGTAESLFDAIEADKTLGIPGVDCTVDKGATPPAWFEPAVPDGRTWLACRFPVDIYETR